MGQQLTCVRVAADHWNFQDATGQYITPIGANVLAGPHPTSGTLFDHFDIELVERRFATMQELGINVIRQPIGVNHVYRPDTGLVSAGMRNWQRFLTLAEQYAVYVIPVGGYLGSNDWFDAAQLADDGPQLDERCAFWQAFVGECTGHPVIFAWDLANELLYDIEQHLTRGQQPVDSELLLLAGWPAYLRTRYGCLAELNAAYHRWGPFAAFADVPGFIRFVDGPGHPIAADFRAYLNEKGYRWSQRQVEEIRAASPLHMVCSGNNGWLFPDMDLWLANGFHNHAHHTLYDFVTIHPYPAPQCLSTGHGDPLDSEQAMRFWLHALVAMARIDFYHKPVVVQELGWYGGGASAFLCPLPYRSEEEHANYLHTVMTCLAPHVNGFLNWPLCDMPDATDISNHGGLLTADGQVKAAAGAFRTYAMAWKHARLQRQNGTTTLTYSLRLLYTSRAYQNAMWEEIHQVMTDGVFPDFRFI